MKLQISDKCFLLKGEPGIMGPPGKTGPPGRGIPGAKVSMCAANNQLL